MQNDRIFGELLPQNQEPELPPQQLGRRVDVYVSAPREGGLSRLAKGIVWTAAILVSLSIIGFFSAGFFISLWTTMAVAHAIHDNSAVTAATSTMPPKLFLVGQPVQVGYWKYTVNGVQYGSTISNGFGGLDQAQGEFVVVDITATNVDRTQSSFPEVHLLGADGTEASEAAAGSLLPRHLDFTTAVNPGLSTRGFVVFDVRPQAYAVQLSGGNESDESALVSIPMPKDAARVSEAAPGVQEDSPKPNEVHITRDIDGINYRKIGADWIRNDMPEACGSADDFSETSYPLVCMLGK